MSSKISLILALIMLLLCLGCGDSDNTPSNTSGDQEDSVALGERFYLRINDVAYIKSEDIKVEFVDVVEDSRCPADVVCIWSGQVNILVSISKNGEDLGNLNLISAGEGDERAAQTFDGYSITLLDVDPYPISTQEIEIFDYLIALLVEKI